MSSNLPPGVTEQMIDDYFGGPEWVGQMEFTCSTEFERKVVTPMLERAIASLTEEPLDYWAATRSPEEVAKMKAHMLDRRVRDVQKTLAEIETQVRTCEWEGETEATIGGGRMYWTCPACGEEHEDPAPEPDDGPDPEREDYEDR